MAHCSKSAGLLDKEICYTKGMWDGAKLSDYFRPVSGLTPGMRAVLVIRVSTRQQGDNLADQERRVIEAVEARGGTVVYVHSYVGSGVYPQLEVAAQAAVERDAVLVAETTDRYQRPRTYVGVLDRSATLKRHHLVQLQHVVNWVPMYTVVHPDQAAGTVRGEQTRRGQHASGRRAGRPLQKTKFKDKWRVVAVTLRAAGMTIRAIATELTKQAGKPVRPSTVLDWLKQAGDGAVRGAQKRPD